MWLSDSFSSFALFLSELPREETALWDRTRVLSSGHFSRPVGKQRARTQVRGREPSGDGGDTHEVA